MAFSSFLPGCCQGSIRAVLLNLFQITWNHRLPISEQHLLGKESCRVRHDIMQKGRKPVFEIDYAIWDPERKLGCKIKLKKKSKKFSDHRVPQILKINKNMLTLDGPADDKVVGNPKYRGSRTKKPIIMNHEIIAYTINRVLFMPS